MAEKEPTIAEMVDAAASGYRHFRAFEHAHVLLTRLQSLEQNEQESKNRADKARQAADNAEAKRDERIKAVNDDIAAAEKRRATAIEKAERAAEGIVAKANDKAQAMISEAERAAQAHNDQRAEYEKAVIEAEKRLNGLRLETREAERKLTEAKGQISRLLTAGGV